MSTQTRPLRAAVNAIKSHSPGAVSRALDLAEFFVIQRLVGFKVPSSPVFDELGTAYFKQAIENARFYLEYGGGGSTVVASKLGKAFLSVDSDPYFMRALAKEVRPTDRERLIYVDIGLTGLWGAPIMQSEPEARRGKWRQYPHAPWQRLLQTGERPDLILLDGRFRVACALVCLKNLGNAPGVTMLVDDYAPRPEYRVIERFAKLEAMHGRMAQFTPQVNDPQALDRALAEHEIDCR